MPRTPAGALRGDGQVLTSAASRPGRQASERRTRAPWGRWVSRSGLPVPTGTSTGAGASPAAAGRAAARAARRAARRVLASWKRAARALVALLPPLARGRSAERGMAGATKLKNGMCSLNFKIHDGRRPPRPQCPLPEVWGASLAELCAAPLATISTPCPGFGGVIGVGVWW